MLASKLWVKLLPAILLGLIFLSFFLQKINGNLSSYEYALSRGGDFGSYGVESHLEISPQNDVPLTYLEIVIVLLAMSYPILAVAKGDRKSFKAKFFTGLAIGVFSSVAGIWGWYGWITGLESLALTFWYTVALVLYLIASGVYYIRLRT